MLATPSLTRWKKTDFTWLALAIGVHCALLLLPLHHLQLPADLRQAEPRQAITVDLVPYPQVMKAQTLPEGEPFMASQETAVTPSRPDSESSTAPPTPISAPASIAADQSLADDTTTKTGIKRISLARLVDLASRMSFTKMQSPAPRQLGSSEYSKQPPSWRTGAAGNALMPAGNTFDGMMAPVETELVDRWQAADGSNNVVINTPNGDTLCGRAEAWNPMQPLVEHLTMFRNCGGGGKRTFSMAARELP
jgi:hypothetical protein